jgi:ABC-type glycerol-3-phosphate transport system substrate-binding protein
MRAKPKRSLRLIGIVLILAAALPPPARVASGFTPAWPADLPARAPVGRPSGSAREAGTPLEIRADRFGLPPASDVTARLYPKPSVFLQADAPANAGVEFTATIRADGVYTLSFDMAAGESFFDPPEGQLRIDGELPVADAGRIVFPLYYQNSAGEFPLDRYGNEGLIRQQRLTRWSNVALRDVEFSQPYPLQLELARGEHRFEFSVTEASLHLGSVYIAPFSPYPDYEQYRQAQPAPDAGGVMITLPAERPAYKNDTAVRPVNSRSLDVSPYDTYRLLLNTLGGESWQRSGSAIYYEFDVPAGGLYAITLRASQNVRNNFTVFRRITVNGEVPFAELNAVPFAYSTEWSNVTLGGATPYRIYLRQGRNVLGLEATSSPYDAAIEKTKRALTDINALSLEIRKLTGNQVDPFKEWVIRDYIPDIADRLVTIADQLAADQAVLAGLNQSGGSPEVQTYQMAIDNLRFLAADPDKIPSYMNRFSAGSGSAAQQLATLLSSLQNQPLALDAIYVHSPEAAPQPVAVPFYQALIEAVKRFIRSFQPDPYQTIGAAPDELEVWVNRPRQYVDLLQSLADTGFTPQTGIRVKFSIMPEESKLILANAAGMQPDVALGVSTNVPFEMAIRGAVKDLRAFSDFDAFIDVYSPGALLSYIIDDSVYAIPETQDFWVTFYRRDILESLGIPVPRTWNEVLAILPELQRYGMNYNSPLSDATGSKGYLATAPYIWNYGGDLYSADGFATGLDSEQAISAITFMAETHTIYGMPVQTASFFESFRNGLLPIGVSNVTTYLKLQSAAPELNGLWAIDLYPATVLADGTQNRYATGSAQAAIMFADTDRPDDAWTLMKWWMSTDTQVDFQEQLVTNYGPAYLWTSANLEAFSRVPMPRAHRAVILEQWQWLQEPVKLPGSYMGERELSNAWNRIVFDGVNPRIAIDSSVILIDREMARKMEEFGYLANGVKVKTIRIPTIETVRRWTANGR